MSPRDQAPSISAQFKARLKAARKQANLTQDELADKAGISVVTLSKLETGVNRPAFDILLALSLALKRSPNDLIGWHDEDREGDGSRKRLLRKLELAVDSLSDEWIEQLISISETAQRS